jgi:RNA polymerase sigma factor (sigma-70 family)
MRPDHAAEDLLRSLAPQVLGALVRRYGHFDLAEDAVQEALLAAAQQWPEKGTPDNPRGWLIRIGSRRLIDQLRSEDARRRREEDIAARAPRDTFIAAAPGEDRRPNRDDTMTLLFLCCHPTLSLPSQVALTLRAVGGLTTAEIARALLTPEATMAQRISRAKQSIKTDGSRFEQPSPEELPERLRAVMHVLYLIFNEGYAATSGPSLQRRELVDESIRLTRELRRLVPGNGETAGLLALMLLTDARRAARINSYGAIVPLLEQDRSLWNQDLIAEGTSILEDVLPHGPTGSYQVQAAIAAVHDEAAEAGQTDWPQILGLYKVLEQVSGENPVVTLNRALATGMVEGASAGLDVLNALEGDKRIGNGHRFEAVRGFLLELADDYVAAANAYRAAGRLTTSLPERRFLEDKASALTP